MRPHRPALALLLALAACPDAGPERGEEAARFVVRTMDGDAVGTSTVWHAAAGEGLVEETRIEAEGAPDQEVDLLLGPEAYRIRRVAGRELEKIEVALGPATRWVRTKGLEVTRRGVAKTPELLYEEQVVPNSGTTGSAAVWMRLARVLAGAEAAELERPALNLQLGRAVTLYLSRRERRELPVGGEPRKVERWFVSTAASGHTVWVDAERGDLLWVDAVFGGYRLAAPGFEPPHRPLRPRPAEVVEEDVYARGEDVRLAGTLSLPAGAAEPRPAVILIHGSGPMDRDEAPFMAFRDIAHRLSQAGWAVLRYDKRGVKESELLEEDPDTTLPALARDVETWIDFLDAREDVDGGCLFLLGHSEGGYIAPLVATRDPRVDGVVNVAGPAESLYVTLAEQLRLILRAHGLPEPEIEAAARSQAALLKVASRSKRLPNRRDQEPGYMKWLRSHAEHDPEAVLARLEVPLYALFAAGDIQVPPSQAEAVRRIAREAKLEDVTVEMVPGLDHLMMDDRGGRSGMGLLADPDRRIAPEVLDRIEAWLHAHRCEG